MATIDQLSVGLALDYRDFGRGLSDAGRQVDAWVGDVARRLESIPMDVKPPRAGAGAGAPGAGAGGPGAGADPGQLAGQLSSALVPLGAKIEQSMSRALVPLNGLGARMSAQLDAVGGTITTLARRIDSAMKFPTAERALAGLRAFAAKKFAEMGDEAPRYAAKIDRAFAIGQGALKARHFFESVGDVARRSMSKLGSFKPPRINFDQSVTSITKITNATNAATQSMRGFGAQIAIALGAFGLTFKAVGFLKDGVKAAANLNETLSKVDTVFGPAAAKVKAQADEMAQAFGLPKGPMLDAAASIGLIGKASGLSEAGAAGMSNQMAKLAADASSFYNVPLDEALNKIKSGLVGESEPMRAFGVLLNEDAVSAEALRLGLVKNKDELTEQSKVAARASLIMGGLKDASGDLERTQGSASNQGRKFSGTMENLGASVGELLLPALTTGLGLLNEFATYLGTAFEANKSTFAGWAETLGTAFATVGKYVRNWQDTFELARLSIYQSLANVGAYVETLGPNIVTIAKYIAENWVDLILDGIEATVTAFANFGKNLTAIGTAIGEWFADPTAGFEVDWTPLLDGFEAASAKMPELLRPAIVDMSEQMAEVADRIEGRESKRLAGQASTASAPAKRGTLAEGPEAESPTKKLREFADKLLKDIQTPAEKYAEGLAKLDKAVAAGLVKPEQYDRARMGVAKEAGIDLETKRAGAAMIGSTEAYSSIVAALSGRNEGWDRLATGQNALIAEARKQTDIQAATLKATDKASKPSVEKV